MSKTSAINTNFPPCPFTGKGSGKGVLFLLFFLLLPLSLSAQNTDKLYKEAKALYDAKNYTQAFPKLKTAAEKGHKKAQYPPGGLD